MPAKSKAQQRLFGIARAVQKGERSASSVSDPAKMIAKKVKKREVDKFASTPSKNLPDRVKKEIKGAIAELVTELLNETPESKKYLFNKKLAAAREKKYVYGTRDNKWHLVGPEDRDYGTAISQADFKKLGPERAKAQYLAPSRVKEQQQMSNLQKQTLQEKLSFPAAIEKLKAAGKHADVLKCLQISKKAGYKAGADYANNLIEKYHLSEASSSGSITVQCQECGKKFKTKSMIPTCPKCGGSDVDLANESVNEARTIGTANRNALKRTTIAMWKKNHDVSEDEIIDTLPTEWWDTWEMADQEIRRIVHDTIMHLTHGQTESKASQLAKLQEKLGRTLTVPEKHGLAIAYKTMKMPDAMVGVMGGMTKQQAKAEIERLTGKKYEPRESTVKEQTPIKEAPVWGKDVEVFDERHTGKSVIIMMRKGNEVRSAIFRKGKENKYNRNNPKDIQTLWQLAKKHGLNVIEGSAGKEKFQCPKCGKSMTPDPKTGLHKCSCGWKETAPKGEGFKIDKGVPVKEQYKVNPEYVWLKSLMQKKTYNVGPVTIMLAFDPGKKVLAINAVCLVNPSHKAEDAPRHIEAALDSITKLKDTIFKLDKIAPHKEKTTPNSVQKLWLLPADKISTWGDEGGPKENVHEYLDESEASDQAKKMGLDYMQFGRWGKKGKVTHQTQNGKLVKVQGGDDMTGPGDAVGRGFAQGGPQFEKPTKSTQKTKPQWVDEPSFKTSTPNTRFSGDSDKWFDDVSEWAIDPMKRGVENDALRVLQKLSKSAPTPKTIKSIYDITSKINRPHLKRVASQAAKILKNAYRKEFGRQFGGGGGKVSQASEFLSHLNQALEYND